MKVALLADIHGNAHALEAVLTAAQHHGVDKLLIAGDLVGYYYDIDQVLDLLTGWDWQAVQGNHERMLGQWLDGEGRSEIKAKYGSGLFEAERRLTYQQLEQLIYLPAMLEQELSGKRLLLCHGSPWDTDCYIYPDAAPEIIGKFFALDRDLVVFGHTHYPMLLQQGDQLAVNPGSVGQPRDRVFGACWALWESDTGKVTLMREQYDPAALIDMVKRIDPQITYLRDVLARK